SPRHVTCRRIGPRPHPHGTPPNGNSGLRHSLAGSPRRAGRIEFVILRTGRSPPAALHLVLRRRSCSRLQVTLTWRGLSPLRPSALSGALAPGFSPARAALKGGATAGAPTKARQGVPLRIGANGDLVVEVNGSEVRFHKPVLYQPTADAVNPKSKIQNRQLLDGRYVLTADNRIKFEIPNYDKSRPLVIDPY